MPHGQWQWQQECWHALSLDKASASRAHIRGGMGSFILQNYKVHAPGLVAVQIYTLPSSRLSMPGWGSPSQCTESFDCCSYSCTRQAFCLMLSSLADIKSVTQRWPQLPFLQSMNSAPCLLHHEMPSGLCCLSSPSGSCPLSLTSCFWHTADICTELMEAYKRQCLLSQAQSQCSTAA